MPFWGEAAGSTTKEPKRNFRFKVLINALDTGLGDGGMVWFAKTCDKPSFTIESTEHQYLNHTFYYPGAVKWQTVSMQLVDPGNPDAVALLASIVQQSGYSPPGAATALTTMSKGKAVDSLGKITIIQLDAAGVAMETWELHNAFVTEAKFGSLEYGSDDLTQIDLTLQYDWALLATAEAAPTAAGGKEFFKAASGA